MTNEAQIGVVSTANESAFHGEIEQKQPIGGAQAWLVVLGASISMFCTQGYISSFGQYLIVRCKRRANHKFHYRSIFQSYYSANFLQTESPSNISWSGSLQVILIFFGGVIAGPLADCYGSKVYLSVSYLRALLKQLHHPMSFNFDLNICRLS